MRVGGEVFSRCGRCQGITAHKIIAIVAEIPAKVECLECRAQHGYRPHKEQKPKKEPKAKKAKDPPAEAPALELVHSRPSLASRIEGKEPIAYWPECKYVEGDVIEHSVFGVGVALAIPKPGLVQIEFDKATKTLACDRAAKAVIVRKGAVGAAYVDRPTAF